MTSHDQASVDDLPAMPAPDRRAAWGRLAFGAAAVVAAFVVAYLVTLPGFSLCTFQIAFGRPCPGCGMTRSIVHLVHGEVLTSLRLHPLGVALFGGCVLVGIGGLLEIATGHDPVWAFMERRGTWVAVGLVVALLVLWVVRAFVVPAWSPDPIGPGLGWRGLLPGTPR